MHIRHSYLSALALLVAATVIVRADTVDDYLKAEMHKHHIPGLSLAVVKEGKIVKAEGYGLANVELNVSARAETVYKIGSISKQLIAAGVMLLVEDGKIGLDDKVGSFLEGTPDAWKEITVRHLLTHTSGIVREAPGFDTLKIQNDADVIKTAFPLPLHFAPGEKWEYCNVGYFALAEIIHKVAGVPWDVFLHNRVFAPLEMNATRATSMTEIVENRADGYVWADGKFKNASIWLALRPSGAFLSSVLDLAKWDAALYSTKILQQTSLDLIRTPVKLTDGISHPYGFGWQLDPIGGHALMHHGGSLPGFRSEIVRFVNDKLTIVILTNGEPAKEAALAVGVANFYIPGLLPDPAASRKD